MEISQKATYSKNDIIDLLKKDVESKGYEINGDIEFKVNNVSLTHVDIDINEPE